MEWLIPKKILVIQLRQLVDVYVSSSIGFDGLAGTIREGLAMGKPTVATDVAGHKEIIRDMETGLLVPPGDDKALASAIVKLVKDKELAFRLAAKGREFVERNMAEDIMVERTEAVYLDLEFPEFSSKAHG